MSDTENGLEEGAELSLDFQKLKKVAACGEDVVPVAVQDADTKEVLIVAYANDQALNYSVRKGVAAFWSTSRNELWVKGATSGDMLDLVEIRLNCEQNSLLYLVRPRGRGACHTKDEAGRLEHL
jgi:phosphoribosyl-AMP cyclohydrolase